MDKKEKVYKVVCALGEIEYKEDKLSDVLGVGKLEMNLFNPAFELVEIILAETLTPEEHESFYDLVYMSFDSFCNIMSPFSFSKFYKELTNEEVA